MEQTETQQELVLIRGLPGSGKTTIAYRMAKGQKLYVAIEADQFFMADGEYVFDYKYLQDAHLWCQSQCRFWLHKGLTVVIANTFVTQQEVDPYRIIAKKYAVPIKVITARGKYQSVHNIPEKTLESMRGRWEEHIFTEPYTPWEGIEHG